MYYSYKSKFPKLLPEVLFLPDGSSKPSSEFSDEELNELGYKGPYEIPIFMDTWNNKMIWDGNEIHVIQRNPLEMQFLGMGFDAILSDTDTPEEILWGRIRDLRDKKLMECDYIERTVELVGKKVYNLNEWKVYRQQLRDIPSDFDSPYDVIFPETPSTVFINSDGTIDEPKYL
jgi:hypothetical protein